MELESADCIVCGKEVRRRQHAIACDVCSKWQHRVCGTNISQADYRRLVRGEIDIDWVCQDCTNPVGNSTTIEDPNVSERLSQIPSPETTFEVTYMSDITQPQIVDDHPPDTDDTDPEQSFGYADHAAQVSIHMSESDEDDEDADMEYHQSVDAARFSIHLSGISDVGYNEHDELYETNGPSLDAAKFSIHISGISDVDPYPDSPERAGPSDHAAQVSINMPEDAYPDSPDTTGPADHAAQVSINMSETEYHDMSVSFPADPAADYMDDYDADRLDRSIFTVI